MSYCLRGLSASCRRNRYRLIKGFESRRLGCDLSRDQAVSALGVALQLQLEYSFADLRLALRRSYLLWVTPHSQEHGDTGYKHTHGHAKHCRVAACGLRDSPEQRWGNARTH